MYVRPPRGGDQVMLAEYFCPACASLVRADITVAGASPAPAPQLLRATVEVRA
jgi:hypothetical protein